MPGPEHEELHLPAAITDSILLNMSVFAMAVALLLAGRVGSGSEDVRMLKLDIPDIEQDADAQTEGAGEDDVKIALTRDGRVFVGGRSLALAEFAAAVAPGASVELAFEKGTDAAVLIGVQERLSRRGVHSVKIPVRERP